MITKQVKARDFQQQCYKWLKIARSGVSIEIKTKDGFLYLNDQEPKIDESEGTELVDHEIEPQYTNYQD